MTLVGGNICDDVGGEKRFFGQNEAGLQKPLDSHVRLTHAHEKVKP
jgi:hypothetical protein